MTTPTPKPISPTSTHEPHVETPAGKTPHKTATIPAAPRHTPHTEGVDRLDPNVIQSSPTQATLVAEPPINSPYASDRPDGEIKEARERGYSLGPGIVQPSITVRNITRNDLFLESGCIQPNQTGLATEAEVSNLLGQYLETA
jgi:hypothetical protein